MNTLGRILEERITSKLNPNKVILVFGARGVNSAFTGAYPDVPFLIVNKETYLQWLDC